jgi:hypothetical protein
MQIIAQDIDLARFFYWNYTVKQLLPPGDEL